MYVFVVIYGRQCHSPATIQSIHLLAIGGTRQASSVHVSASIGLFLWHLAPGTRRQAALPLIVSIAQRCRQKVWTSEWVGDTRARVLNHARAHLCPLVRCDKVTPSARNRTPIRRPAVLESGRSDDNALNTPMTVSVSSGASRCQE